MYNVDRAMGIPGNGKKPPTVAICVATRSTKFSY